MHVLSGDADLVPNDDRSHAAAEVKLAVSGQHQVVAEQPVAGQLARLVAGGTGAGVFDDAKSVHKGFDQGRLGAGAFVHDDHVGVVRQPCKAVAGVGGFVVQDDGFEGVCGSGDDVAAVLDVLDGSALVHAGQHGTVGDGVGSDGDVALRFDAAGVVEQAACALASLSAFNVEVTHAVDTRLVADDVLALQGHAATAEDDVAVFQLLCGFQGEVAAGGAGGEGTAEGGAQLAGCHDLTTAVAKAAPA